LAPVENVIVFDEAAIARKTQPGFFKSDIQIDRFITPQFIVTLEFHKVMA
jgi:hypothetical protein